MALAIEFKEIFWKEFSLLNSLTIKLGNDYEEKKKDVHF